MENVWNVKNITSRHVVAHLHYFQNDMTFFLEIRKIRIKKNEKVNTL